MNNHYIKSTLFNMTLIPINLQQDEINLNCCSGLSQILLFFFTTHECKKKKKPLYDAPLIMTITKYSSSDLAKALAEASRNSCENSHGGKT